MAARSKGTLLTTHRAEYVSPFMYPKYSGHFPNVKQESGKGFAQATKEHFQVERRKRERKGGEREREERKGGETIDTVDSALSELGFNEIALLKK